MDNTSNTIAYTSLFFHIPAQNFPPRRKSSAFGFTATSDAHKMLQSHILPPFGCPLARQAQIAVYILTQT